MGDDPLLSSRIKFSRAEKHLLDIKSEIDSFTARDPYRVIADRESEPAITIHRLVINEPIPVGLSPLIGDLLHNLMSALDSLACSVIKANGIFGEKELSETYFPIHWCREDFSSNEKTARFLHRAGKKASDIIYDLEPYRDGRGEPLLRLKNLNKQDKHRAIIPVLSSVGNIEFDKNMLFAGPLPEPKLVTNLKNGDELLRTMFCEPHYFANTHFVFSLGIDERSPLMDDLSNMIACVFKVIHRFERDFFR